MSLGVGEEVAKLPYTYRYFRELSPSFLAFVLLNEGVAFDAARPLRYLELGFGQGVSLNVHAAACGGAYWGNDFNPDHVAYAQALAGASGADVRIGVDTFAQLAANGDLPEFDVIALHGVWTWVADEDRAAIIEIARRALAPGGVLYVSYNCLMGWGAALGLRDLLAAHAQLETPASAPVERKVASALAFANQLAKAGGGYFADHPRIVAQLEDMAARDPAYVAHELFGSHWHLSSFAEVSAQLAAADLRFAVSAMPLMHDYEAHLGADARAVLAGLNDPVVRETARDAFANTPFREDVFVKGNARRLSADERQQALSHWRLALTTPFGSLAPSIRWMGVDLNMATDENVKIVQALRAGNYAPKTLAEVAAATGGAPDAVLKALVALIGAGAVQPLQPYRDADAKARCAKLNGFLCDRAAADPRITTLASPLLGAGVTVRPLWQIFVSAIAAGKATPADLAAFAAERLRAPGQAVPAKLEEEARVFGQTMLPILRAIEVV